MNHQIRRAIIMAAGAGERLQPITLSTPKPLVRVNGQRMIDTIIRGLRRHGITEIHVVVGYLKEQFASLPEEYPGLTLIENPHYAECNNISSLYAARDYLHDVMILDGDQLIYDDSVLSPYFKRSGYNAVWTDEPTDEWLMTVADGVVTACSRTGGAHGWQLYSISRWTAEDGEKLRQHLIREFEEEKNRGIYWDDVALFRYPDEYKLGIYPMAADAVKEIDRIDELIATDPSYAGCRGGLHNG